MTRKRCQPNIRETAAAKRCQPNVGRNAGRFWRCIQLIDFKSLTGSGARAMAVLRIGWHLLGAEVTLSRGELVARLIDPNLVERVGGTFRDGSGSVDSERLPALSGTWRFLVSARAATGRFHATCQAR